MNNSRIISGTAMAVLLGFGAILSAIFVPSIDLGSRIILGFLGIVMIWLGIYFSRG
ncbi:MAG: hypothetical protein QXS37_02655 [Candidatus Aenigmatarchaeota archaeon]